MKSSGFAHGACLSCGAQHYSPQSEREHSFEYDLFDVHPFPISNPDTGEDVRPLTLEIMRSLAIPAGRTLGSIQAEPILERLLTGEWYDARARLLYEQIRERLSRFIREEASAECDLTWLDSISLQDLANLWSLYSERGQFFDEQVDMRRIMESESKGRLSEMERELIALREQVYSAKPKTVIVTPPGRPRTIVVQRPSKPQTIMIQPPGKPNSVKVGRVNR